MAFNKVVLLGNLTADPETRTTPSGQNVTSFSLAVNRTWNDASGQRQEETSFINCTAWGPRGETIAKYVGKGRQLLVSGRLQQRSWDDKETGKKRSRVEVTATDVTFLDGAGAGAGAGGANSGGSAARPAAQSKPVVDDIDDKPIDLSEIPF